MAGLNFQAGYADVLGERLNPGSTAHSKTYCRSVWAFLNGFNPKM